MSEDPISQLAALIARHQVIETIDLLFAATDAKDWATVRGVLAPAVRFDMSSAGGPPASMRTGEAIAADWEAGLAPLQAIHHQAGNYRVGLTDIDRAGAFCYGIAYHYLPKASGQNTRVFVGSYDFELARTGDTWRITAFKYNLKFIDGNRELEKPD